MNDKKNKRVALSLPEALVTLLLVAITAVASVPVFLKKFEKKDQVSHGIWECRLTPSGHTETKRRRDGTIQSGPTSVGSACTFKPPAGATDFNVDICGSGAHSYCNFEDGTHVMIVYPTLNKDIKVTLLGEKVLFGELAFAYGASAGARVIVVY